MSLITDEHILCFPDLDSPLLILTTERLFSLGEIIQVQCTILDAWGWCTRTTQKDGTGREEGGGFRMGNMWQIHVDIWKNKYNIVKLKNKIINKINKINQLPRWC